MPSMDTPRKFPVVVAVSLTLLYVYASGRIVSGVFVGVISYLVAWFVARLSPDDILGRVRADMTQRRILVTGVLVLTILTYSLLIIGNILFGGVVSLMLVATAWLTSPSGPVARWLDRRA